ncbi:MAG: hypothetical protein O3B13_16275, partial [Planctomycetota bacterium]|nr:hypothetical protein [Planctomycetota bacterium]
MSDRPSDAELIRICLEGTASDLTDSVLAEIRDRFETSALLQAAVSESPLSKVITKQLGVSADAVTAGTSRRQTTGSRRLKLLSGAVVCGLLTGLAMWINGQGDGEVDPLPLGPVAETETGDVAPVPASTAGDAQPSSGEATKPHNGKPTETTDTAKAPAHRSPDEMEPESASRTTVAAVPLSPAGSPDDQPPIWAESLSLEVPPRTFENVAWVLPGQEKADQFTPADCRRWLSPVPGKPFQMGELKVDTRVFTSFNGIATLRAPWVDAAVLRLGMYDAERCTITIWQGNRGVQLRYYRSRNPNLWGVYSVSRNGPEGEDALPRVGHLMITDSGRWHRTNLGTFDLRWSDGFLRMVRGNVVLLTVPFEARPEEVVLDGKMNLRELRMFRSDPLPDYVVDRAKSAAGPNSLPSVKPAELEWSTAEVPDRAFSKNTADGTVRLVTTSTSEKLSRAWSSIPAAGLSEMIFRISSADPGTGVYFGGADGEPIFQVATVWDTAASRPAIWFRLAAQHELETRFDSGGQAAPWTGRDQWLRVVAGYGMTTIEISPDGIHWGWLTDTPIRTDWEQLATIGVYTEPKGDRQIQLSQISVNEFSTLPAVADPTLIARVDIAGFEPLKLLDMGSWLHRVIRFQPSGVAFDAWRRACAVATLRARPRAELGTFLLNGLLTDGAFSDEALKDSDDDQAWNLLNEVSQLVSVVDSNRTVQFQQLYHERARRRVISDFEHHRRNDDQTGTERAVSLSDIRNMTSAFLSSPLWSSQPSAMTPQDATRLELIALVQEGRLAAVRTLVDQVVFWNAHSHPQRDWWSQVDPLYPTVAWAELRSHETLDSEAQSERLSLPRRWKTGLIPERHPLAQPVSKEAYNVMAEFQAAVSGAAFQDACQVISSAGSADLIGLLPDSLDDQLLVSFPNAVALAMDQYPELRHQMNERFGAIGRLRVR